MDDTKTAPLDATTTALTLAGFRTADTCIFNFRRSLTDGIFHFDSPEKNVHLVVNYGGTHY